MKLLSLVNVNVVLASVGMFLFLWVLIEHNVNDTEAEHAEQNRKLARTLAEKLNHDEMIPQVPIEGKHIQSDLQRQQQVPPIVGRSLPVVVATTATTTTTITTTTAPTTRSTTTTPPTTTTTTTRTTTTTTTITTTTTASATTAAAASAVQKDEKIHLVFTATNSHGVNSPIMTMFKDCLGSICSRTHEELVLHLITDAASKDDALKLAKATCHPGRTEVVMYDATAIVDKAKALLGNMQDHFSSGGYYGQGIFFLEPVFHLVLPEEIERIIVLDLDLHFTTDVRNLHRQFGAFGPSAVMGLVQEQQPVYRHLLHRYRDQNKGTHLGSAGPGGFTGFNSGVLLMNLARMRSSALYSRIFNTSMITDLTAKFSFKGHLGDQDMYTLIACEHPELFHTLACGWNRQLCVWWRDHGYSEVFDQYWACDMPIHVWHGNCKTKYPDEMPDT